MRRGRRPGSGPAVPLQQRRTDSLRCALRNGLGREPVVRLLINTFFPGHFLVQNTIQLQNLRQQAAVGGNLAGKGLLPRFLCRGAVQQRPKALPGFRIQAVPLLRVFYL